MDPPKFEPRMRPCHTPGVGRDEPDRRALASGSNPHSLNSGRLSASASWPPALRSPVIALATPVVLAERPAVVAAQALVAAQPILALVAVLRAVRRLLLLRHPMPMP